MKIYETKDYQENEQTAANILSAHGYFKARIVILGLATWFITTDRNIRSVSRLV